VVKKIRGSVNYLILFYFGFTAKKPKTLFNELLPEGLGSKSKLLKGIEDEDKEMRRLFKRLKGRVKVSYPPIPHAHIPQTLSAPKP
jgi:hypothetical protein